MVIGAVDSSNQTALHRAISTGEKDIVELFLDGGAEIEATNSDGQEKLGHCAASLG